MRSPSSVPNCSVANRHAFIGAERYCFAGRTQNKQTLHTSFDAKIQQSVERIQVGGAIRLKRRHYRHEDASLRQRSL